MQVGADGRWQPGIGDPTLSGWLTVVAYGVVAVLATRAALSMRKGQEGLFAPGDRQRLVRFWVVVAIVMLLLGVNKQLDLQSWFTQVARDLSKQGGWYESRRQVQFGFVVALACAGTVAIALMGFRMRRVWRRVAGAVVGLGVVTTFVMIRAASFHHIDMLLVSGPLPLNWALELGGIGLIGLTAWLGSQPRQSGR
jgi:hypothetical protein